MAKITMELVMSDALQERLITAAKTQGKTVQEFMQEALYTYVEDIEDGVLSDVALAEEGIIPKFPEGERAVALDHSIYEASRKTA